MKYDLKAQERKPSKIQHCVLGVRVVAVVVVVVALSVVNVKI